MMTFMAGEMDLRAAAAAFDRSSAPEAETAAKGERKQVLAQFPLEEWATLPLSRYALGQTAPSGSGPTYCRLMEFGTPNLGSIKGGSAAKHIMYHHNSGEWRVAAPLRGMEPQEAWEELRGQFVRAFEAVAAEDFAAVDDLEVLRFGPTLVTKSLATYFPEHFLPIYAAEHLRKFVTLLGGTPRTDASAWHTNRRLLELVRSRAEFDGWSGQEVMRLLYERFNPRAQQRTIWKIAPGERGRLWDECRDDGVIRVGWDELGDLGQYQSDTELKQALDAQWPRSSGGSLTLARRLLAFRDLEAGDRIVANRGMDEVLATGTVNGSYRFDAEHAEYQHVVPVSWDVSHARKLPEPQPGWRSTFAKVQPTFFARLATGPAEPGTNSKEPYADGHVTLPEDVAGVLEALERKGQVILHGPPGTGKTRLALGAALVLAGRAGALNSTPGQRAAAQAEMLRDGRNRHRRPVGTGGVLRVPQHPHRPSPRRGSPDRARLPAAGRRADRHLGRPGRRLPSRGDPAPGGLLPRPCRPAAPHPRRSRRRGHRTPRADVAAGPRRRPGDRVHQRHAGPRCLTTPRFGSQSTEPYC